MFYSDVPPWMEEIQRARVFDLAQSYYLGMPHFPSHPPFLYSLTKKHGDLVGEGGVSSAADSIALGTHVGTHIDALCHFSSGGKLYSGWDAGPFQSYERGMRILGVETMAPILGRGVLLDIAGNEGVDALPKDFTIAPEHLERAEESQGVRVTEGAVALLRTGWARYFSDGAKYITGGSGTHPAGPGPALDGARWLSARKIFAAGSDTVAFERVPDPAMPVHVHLLVESGIHIIEALDLEELARSRVYEFLFVAIPLKIRGGTGSPLRPIALASAVETDG